MNHLLLDDRILWEDGTLTVPAELISDYIQFAEDGRLYTDEITDDIKEYNKLSASDKKIKIKKNLKELSTDWIIPKSITSINLEEYIDKKLAIEIRNNNFTEKQIQERVERLFFEFKKLADAKLIELIYVILYVINTFEANKVVWGVGRGSSTSSYLLYILGIHDVDSVEYDLDFTEFLH